MQYSTTVARSSSDWGNQWCEAFIQGRMKRPLLSEWVILKPHPPGAIFHEDWVMRLTNPRTPQAPYCTLFHIFAYIMQNSWANFTGHNMKGGVTQPSTVHPPKNFDTCFWICRTGSQLIGTRREGWATGWWGWPTLHSLHSQLSQE